MAELKIKIDINDHINVSDLKKQAIEMLEAGTPLEEVTAFISKEMSRQFDERFNKTA